MSDHPKRAESVTVTPKRAGDGARVYDVQLDLTIIEPLFHMRQEDAAKFLVSSWSPQRLHALALNECRRASP